MPPKAKAGPPLPPRVLDAWEAAKSPPEEEIDLNDPSEYSRVKLIAAYTSALRLNAPGYQGLPLESTARSAAAAQLHSNTCFNATHRACCGFN